MLSCKEVSELSSRLLDENLSWSTRFKLKLHLMMCKQCVEYKKKMALTKATIEYWINGRQMPEAVRVKLIQELEGNDACDNHKHQ